MSEALPLEPKFSLQYYDIKDVYQHPDKKLATKTEELFADYANQS
jgi:hypothetical protein